MRKHLAAALSGLAAVWLGLTGCSSASDPGTNVAAAADIAQCDPTKSTLTISHQPPAKEAVAVAVKRMNEQFPTLKISVNALPTATYDEFTRAVVADIAVGKRPDLIVSGLGQLRFWVEKYRPVPINSGSLADTYRKQFLAAGTVDGTVYLAPAQVSVPVLAVNQSLLAKAGAGQAQNIRTYDDLIGAARKVTAMTGRPSVTIGTNNIPDWLSQAFVQGAGGTFVTADGLPAFGDKLGVQAVSLWSRLKGEGLELGIVKDADSQAAFTNGTAAFVITSSSAIAAFQTNIKNAFEWMPVDLPTVNGQHGTMPAGGNGWIVLSDDPCRAAFAQATLGHLLSKEGVLAASGTSYSYIPVDSAAATELLGGTAATPQTTYAWGYDRPVSPWGGWRRGDVTGQIVDVFRTMSQQLQAGADAEKTVATAVTTINGLLAR
jgi:multiple sugar transport system substrate-binding protein